jgi:uncharacterized spore protein YtfJ
MEANFKQNIESLFERFEKFLKEKTVIGEPIKMGNITMIPAITVSFGLGNGVGNGTDQKGNGGNGSGGGIGAKVSPTAMIVVKGDDVQILPISKGHAFEKLIDMVPGIMEKIDMKCKKEDKAQEE